MGSIEDFHRQIWATLGPLDEAAFEALAARPASDAEVDAVTTVLDAPLPAEFVAFSAKSNGLLVCARDEIWPEPEEGAIGPAWSFWRGVLLLGFDTEDLPGWASIARASERLHDLGVEGIAPVFKVLGDGERIWGVNRTGASVLVTNGEVETLSASIADLYAEQIKELVSRQQKISNASRKAHSLST